MLNSPQDAARKILELMKATYQRPLEYVPADEADFSHLDLPAYRAFAAWTGRRGFRVLGDLEIPAVSNQPGSVLARTFIRASVSPDGATLCEYYQIKPRVGRVLRRYLIGLINLRWIASTRWMLGAMRTRHCVGFETEFDDGDFILTSNAQAAGVIGLPPTIDSQVFDYGEAPAVLLKAHQTRVKARLGALPGVHRVKLGGVDDLLAQQHRQSVQKSTFRMAQEWITRAEVGAMAGNADVAAAVYAEVRKLQEA